MRVHTASIQQLAEFDEIIDVRSPSEFAIDHIPGAKNFPVLNDEEHEKIGLLHKTDPFNARRLGAALISKNVSRFLQMDSFVRDKSWHPLIYCWRGGMRSGSLAIIMSQIGWQVHQLQGGYKAYRRMILEELETLCEKLNFIALCGPTGSGKSRFLDILKNNGQQILDLEGLAVHRGSILGLLPGQVQPSQRGFETSLWQEIRQFDSSLPVFIESESRRIGLVTLPPTLYQRMHAAKCLSLDVAIPERIRFLCVEYDFYLKEPSLLIQKFSALRELRSKQELERWTEMTLSGNFEQLVKELLEIHYDPLYWRSLHKHYQNLDRGTTLKISQLTDEVLDSVAKDYCQTM